MEKNPDSMLKKIQSKNNIKGFSLVELIIVIAIMVALIVVVAPSYIKYVAKAKDAVITQAAEDVLSTVKTEHTEGTLTGTGVIRIASNSGKLISIRMSSGLKFNGKACYKANDEDADPEGLKEFKEVCGLREQSSTSQLAYEIIIGSDDLVRSADGEENWLKIVKKDNGTQEVDPNDSAQQNNS